MVSLARVYKPLGGILQEQGAYESVFGYLGAQLDRISGLLYADGRYFDPTTGRFLTPNRRVDAYHPRSLNPYVPWVDPTMLLLAPLMVWATLAAEERRRRYGRWIWILLLLCVAVSVVGCGNDEDEDEATPITVTVWIPPTMPTPTGTVSIAGAVKYFTQTPTTPLTSVATPTATEILATSTCTATPEIEWLDGEFTITHYTFALENDPIYDDDPRVSANGLPSERQYREGFLYGQNGIRQQGTGLAEDGQYITIDWNRGNPRGAPNEVYFTYGIGGRYANPVAWETVATGDLRLPEGTRIVLEMYPNLVFTVTDTGDDVGAGEIDVFVGAITINEAFDLGEHSSRVGIQR